MDEDFQIPIETERPTIRHPKSPRVSADLFGLNTESTERSSTRVTERLLENELPTPPMSGPNKPRHIFSGSHDFGSDTNVHTSSGATASDDRTYSDDKQPVQRNKPSGPQKIPLEQPKNDIQYENDEISGKIRICKKCSKIMRPPEVRYIKKPIFSELTKEQSAKLDTDYSFYIKKILSADESLKDVYKLAQDATLEQKYFLYERLVRNIAITKQVSKYKSAIAVVSCIIQFFMSVVLKIDFDGYLKRQEKLTEKYERLLYEISAEYYAPITKQSPWSTLIWGYVLSFFIFTAGKVAIHLLGKNFPVPSVIVTPLMDKCMDFIDSFFDDSTVTPTANLEELMKSMGTTAKPKKEDDFSKIANTFESISGMFAPTSTKQDTVRRSPRHYMPTNED